MKSKKLAEQSSVSARQITGMIKNIQGETEGITEKINLGVNEVRDADIVVASTSKALNDIKDSNAMVNEEIKFITMGIRRLLGNVTNINTSSKGISDIAATLAANSEEITASTEEQTSSLEQMMTTSELVAKNALELMKNLKVYLYESN